MLIGDNIHAPSALKVDQCHGRHRRLLARQLPLTATGVSRHQGAKAGSPTLAAYLHGLFQHCVRDLSESPSPWLSILAVNRID